MKISPPALCWRGFAAQKGDDGAGPLEDAFSGDPVRGRFAVADGASESAFADVWAKMLVENFVQTPGRWSTSARRSWYHKCSASDMPWYLERKFADGAFAAFLGVFFRGADRWKSIAIGDCCLFHLRDGKLQLAFPICHSDEFSQSPFLLCSRREPRGQRPKPRRLTGDWDDHDLLLMATDSLSAWLLRELEEGRTPWSEVLGLKGQHDYLDWIRNKRDRREIRNDDSTMLIIKNAEGGSGKAEEGA